MTAESILSRLDRVRQTGQNTWLARCPAHPDRSPSLSVRELDDGCVLIHCFAGCDTAAILSAVGLEFADLFPPKSIDHAKPQCRPFPALDALRALSLEVGVVLVAARDMLDAGDLVLGKEGFERLALAADRIQSGLALVRGSGRHG